MDPATLKAFAHALINYAKVKWNSSLLNALLSGTESAFDVLIDDFVKTPDGKKFTEAA